MQPRDRGVMRVPDDCVQLALLQVPHCDHARAPTCRHEWNARACNLRSLNGQISQLNARWKAL